MEAKEFNIKNIVTLTQSSTKFIFGPLQLWQQLLKPDENKMIIINSLQWLVQKGLVKIYGYVIMPNHIHLLWEQLKMNGKEFPKNSFEKFTAKSFVNKMKKGKDAALQNYAVAATDRQYNIWLRDPLAINVFSREMA